MVDDWYLASYRPIMLDGMLVGILFVGIPEKDMAGLKKLFANKKYFESGYPFIVDKNGTLVIHPTNEGEFV